MGSLNLSFWQCCTLLWVRVDHSSFKSKSRGEAILLHKSLPFLHSDPNGRLTNATGQIHNICLVLANVYAPNQGDDAFLEHVSSTRQSMSSRYLGLRSNEDFLGFVLQQIDHFLNLNKAPGVSASLLRETMKAYIIIVLYTGYKTKRKREKITKRR